MAGVHFFSVALHEIGHSLGLAHSYEIEAVMFPYYSEQHYGLKQDDINGIRQLYRKWTFSCYLKNGQLDFKGLLDISISMSLAYRYIYFAYCSEFFIFYKGFDNGHNSVVRSGVINYFQSNPMLGLPTTP